VTAEHQTLTIRQMTEDDIDGLASVLGCARRGIEIRYREQVEGKREVFVGDVDQMAVSSVSINIHSDVPGSLHLFALDVAPAFQRRGFGTALIETVERQASLRRLDGVWLDVGIDNPDAMRLYERLGYRREGAVVVNRWSYVDERGEQKNVGEPCYRMFKRSGPPANDAQT
jgi:ribosomal protein S18 acetylase RimI-like enzyme